MSFRGNGETEESKIFSHQNLMSYRYSYAIDNRVRTPYIGILDPSLRSG